MICFPSHILYLMFTMAGTIDAKEGQSHSQHQPQSPSGIPNVAAFRDVLCDLELWHEAPDDLEKSLLEHFYELLADTSEYKNFTFPWVFFPCDIRSQVHQLLKFAINMMASYRYLFLKTLLAIITSKYQKVLVL